MKLALILPQGRLWSWYRQLADRLGEMNSVDVYTAPCTPLPICLRALVSVERMLYRSKSNAPPLLAVSPEHWRCGLHTFSPDAYELIIDFAQTRVSQEAHCLHLRYNGRTDETALWACLIRGRPSVLEIVDHVDQPLAVSYAGLELKLQFLRGLDGMHNRIQALTMRAIRRASAGDEYQSALRAPVDRPPFSFRCASVLSFGLRSLWSKIRERLRQDTHWPAHWSLGLRFVSAQHSPWAQDGFAPLNAPPGMFLADPCLFENEGKTFVFAEGLDFGSRKGRIVCAQLEADGTVGPFKTALEEAHHLSYPFVFSHDGDIFMAPEGGETGRVDLYRAAQFPHVWTFAQTLITDTRLVDSTLFQHGKYWWLFAGGSEEGGSTHDELFAYYSGNLFGPWVAHAQSPLRSDIRGSRPAGKVFWYEGRLIRPSQDNEPNYGEGLVWNEILSLDPTHYEEREIARWGGKILPPFDGVHTYSRCGEFEMIDLRSLGAPRFQRT